MTKKTGNSIYLKEYNRCMLLSLLWQHLNMSYTALSKMSGLAPKSVYEIINGLIQEDFVVEASIGKSSGGRKPAILSLKPCSYYSIGVDIDEGRVKAVLMDITGSVSYEYETKTYTTDYDYHADLILNITDHIIKSFKIPFDKLLGVGISVPGFINSKTKKIIMAPNLGWENKDLINDLKNRLSFTIYLENEAMASAVCEKWIGECKNDRDFICINIMSGIGAGIYTSDKPFHGVSGSAGEIGHIPMDKNGPICACKNRGCLETFSSTKAILKKAKEEYGEDISLDSLIGFARNEDKKALCIFDNSADYLGLAISYLVNTFNPSRIVLGKDFVKYSDLMLDTVRRRVKTTALKNNYDYVDITVSKFGERAPVLGAAMLPVRTIFNI